MYISELLWKVEIGESGNGNNQSSKGKFLAKISKYNKIKRTGLNE